MPYVDLHIHSIASDGTWKPKKALKVADDLELAAVSFTDHDTVEGTIEAMKLSDEYSVEIVPGIEFNSYYKGKSIHVLGYFIELDNSKLLREAEKQRLSRRKRAEKVLEKLEDIDIYVTMERLREIAGGDTISKTHICAAIIEELKKEPDIETFNEVYNIYLKEGGKVYEERKKISAEKAIETILNANGIPVIAHPGETKGDDVIIDLVEAGLKGIEVYHPKHNKETTRHYLDFARESNLLITGGSDSHGPGSGNDVQIGAARVPEAVYEDLKEYKKNL